MARCVMYSGQVSAGGSICLEALTTCGTPGSWQSSFTVESLLNVIMVNMIDTPVVYIQTPTGPGGGAHLHTHQRSLLFEAAGCSSLWPDAVASVQCCSSSILCKSI
eukprot:GHUV01036124.1.p2 GENE.GHUV01036124.1~~GHUV01036124.1.p2  ORF type:complete len:106 (-),score=22.36 GHUV01036124.1:2-319(-)